MCERLAGRLKASVDFGQIDELTGGSIDNFLVNITRQCEQIHDAVYAAYIAYDAENEAVWKDAHPEVPRNGPSGQEGLSFAVRRGDLLVVCMDTSFSGAGSAKLSFVDGGHYRRRKNSERGSNRLRMSRRG